MPGGGAAGRDRTQKSNKHQKLKEKIKKKGKSLITDLLSYTSAALHW